MYIMSYLLEDLKPEPVWIFFEELSRIPRCSKNEEKVQDYLRRWAKRNNIEYKKDQTGNVLLTREADRGFEHVSPLMFQAHQDMVCEKTPKSGHDFSSDPIPLVVESGKVMAYNTTLGADNGIGMALAMAVLVNDTLIGNGKLEALFTVDEESGFTGVRNLKPDFFKSKYMINLDSEEIGVINVSSAGSGSTTYTIDYRPQSPDLRVCLRIELSGLKGGHSGVDIHKPRYNANKLLAEGLLKLHSDIPIRLVGFEGGSRTNVIPRSAYADVLVPSRRLDKAIEIIKRWYNRIDSSNEEGLRVNIEPIEPKPAAPIYETEKMIYLLSRLPFGPKSWSPDFENLVQTSNNPAIVKTEDNKFTIVVSSRTSDVVDGYENQRTLFELGEEYRVRIDQKDFSVGWKADVDSKLLKLVENVYGVVMNSKPVITGIHGGLECGVIAGLKRGMEIVSIGPTIKNPHSPSEYIEIDGVDLLYNTLLMISTKMRTL